MDNSELARKINKAEKLRKKRGGLLSFFTHPDYYSSAELFAEVAKAHTGLPEQETYYNEAARTFLMDRGEYSFYRAAEMYKALAEAHLNQGSCAKAVAYGVLNGENLEKAERYMLAGTAFMDAGVAAEKMAASPAAEDSSTEEPGAASPAASHSCAECPTTTAISCFKRAAGLFARDGSCPFHTKKAWERCLLAQLHENDLNGAYETLGCLSIKYARLCRLLLAIITEKEVENDVEDAEENDLVMTLINKEKKDAMQKLEDFANNNFLPDYAGLVFTFVIDRLRPENDIC